MSQHTAGPWQIEGDPAMESFWLSTMHPSPIFEISAITGSAEEVKANARLIATAPELLEGLRYARRFMKHEDHDIVWIDGIIAKAEGGAS